ncbi:hypothetical protein GCM10022254_51960 [Actinomadura meridiana]|uniref:SGNH hydrolase-type esterase domain-containing protein n=2 Tax=Actinomadura meridiana TaxID=559626 RepID=A0ABP8CDM7_9ACTN
MRLEESVPNMPDWDSPDPGRARELWEYASSQFAEQTSDQAWVVKGKCVREHNVWEDREFPALKASGKVKCIWQVDENDLTHEKLIWNAWWWGGTCSGEVHLRNKAAQACAAYNPPNYQWNHPDDEVHWTHYYGWAFIGGGKPYGGTRGDNVPSEAVGYQFSIEPNDDGPSDPQYFLDHNDRVLAWFMPGSKTPDFLRIRPQSEFWPRGDEPAPEVCSFGTAIRNGTAQTLRPMGLGSSTTYGEGSSDGNGYRDTADQGLSALAEQNAGHTGDHLAPSAARKAVAGADDSTPLVDWVGSVRVGTMADREVEGWRGFRIDEIAGKAECAVKTYQPNIITLIAGGNDVLQNYQMDGAIGRLQSLIEQVTTDAPGVTVLVAGVQPLRDPGSNARGEAFTAQIPAMVDRLADRGVRVLYTDTTGLELSDIGADGIHPTDQGYEKIGDAFVKAAGQANERGWIRQPTAQADNAGSNPCGLKDDGPGQTPPAQNKLGQHWDDRGVIQAQQFSSSNRFWMVDINKDGKAEYVTVDKDQNFRFWWNSGPSGKNWTPFVEGQNSYKPSPGAVGNQLRFGDVDGDGFPDCMVVNSEGGVFVSTWKADNPSGSRMCMDKEKFAGGASVYSEGSSGSKPRIDPSIQIRFADVTGGGRDDYLLIEPDGTATAWYNKGLQIDRTRPYLEWAQPEKIADALANPRQIRYADINGDKRADRILITAKGGARAWINEGAKGAGGTYRDIGRIAGDGDLPPQDIQFADLDGDGKSDFLRIGWTGVAHAWLNKLPSDYFDTFHP